MTVAVPDYDQGDHDDDPEHETTQNGKGYRHDSQDVERLRRLAGHEHQVPAFGVDASTAMVPARSPIVKQARVIMVTDLVLAGVTAWLEATENESEQMITAPRQSAEKKTRTVPILQPHFTSAHQCRMASRHKISTGMRKSPRPSAVDVSPHLNAKTGIEAATTKPSIGRAMASSGRTHGNQCSISR